MSRDRSELCHKHRPTKLSEVVGQEAATLVLSRYIRSKRVPHAMLFDGPSGTGKTTCARIMQTELRCSQFDYQELNAASYRGIEMVRDIETRMRLSPMKGKTRLWVIDEAGELTKPAQNAILKVLEDPPSHVYLILCTTDPGKLKRTIHTRCTRVTFGQISDEALRKLVVSVCKKEEVEVPKGVIKKVVEHSQGSARQALNILDKVVQQSGKKDMLKAIEAIDEQAVAFDLVKTMIPFRGKTDWKAVSQVLQDIKDENPEGIRQLILKVCQTHMLKGGPMAVRAFDVYQSFRDNFYDSGQAGLVASAFEVCHKLVR